MRSIFSRVLGRVRDFLVFIFFVCLAPIYVLLYLMLGKPDDDLIE